jgi:hypothetical protein
MREKKDTHCNIHSRRRFRSLRPITREKPPMTMARAQLGDVSVTRWYHCITRCVRRAFLLAEGPLDRKEWIELRP